MSKRVLDTLKYVLKMQDAQSLEDYDRMLELHDYLEYRIARDE